MYFYLYRLYCISNHFLNQYLMLKKSQKLIMYNTWAFYT